MTKMNYLKCLFLTNNKKSFTKVGSIDRIRLLQIYYEIIKIIFSEDSMDKNKRLGRKIKLTFIKSAAAIMILLTLGYPFFEKSKTPDEAGYFLVSLNGQELGAVNDEKIAKEVLKEARIKVTKEIDSLVFLEPELKVEKVDKLFGTRIEESELEDKMQQVLAENIISHKQEAYTVKIEDIVIHLGTKEEVVELLEAAKNRFDVDEEFHVVLVEDKESSFTALTTNIVKAGIELNETDTVFSAMNTSLPTVGTTQGRTDGIVSVDFEENVDIVESYVSTEQLSTVSAALDLLTKEKEKNQIYQVESGDCISIIAEKNKISSAKIYELNEGITESTTLQIGDELVVAVAEPDLSVLVKEERTYEENYQADTIYIDNSSWYTTQTVVRQEGSVGHREVVATISTRNGKEYNREIIEETIMVKSEPQIVERGTKTPPTYIKPLSGGTLTSKFGLRWGRMHEGVDWGCGTGTTIKASSGGTVVSAGWSSGYGYKVDILHPDGKKTRYAHLSKVTVRSGQSVKQGERIGYSGNTGRSTGPHLHFEILVNGVPVNPLKYLN